MLINKLLSCINCTSPLYKKQVQTTRSTCGLHLLYHISGLIYVIFRISGTDYIYDLQPFRLWLLPVH